MILIRVLNCGNFAQIHTHLSHTVLNSPPRFWVTLSNSPPRQLFGDFSFCISSNFFSFWATFWALSNFYFSRNSEILSVLKLALIPYFTIFLVENLWLFLSNFLKNFFRRNLFWNFEQLVDSPKHQHISLDLGQKIIRISSLKKNCCDLNLGESTCIWIFTFFLFPDSGLNLLRPSQ